MIRLAPIRPSAKAVAFSRFAAAARQGMQDAAQDARADFEQTTATWQHQPVFEVKAFGDGFAVGTRDAIYGYVDKGTRAHLIRARRARFLHFAPGGRAKTSPARLRSGSGSAGSGDVFARQVQHPGTAARQFSKLIGAKYRAQLKQYVARRIREAM